MTSINWARGRDISGSDMCCDYHKNKAAAAASDAEEEDEEEDEEP
jgi:hypothetical protein